MAKTPAPRIVRVVGERAWVVWDVCAAVQWVGVRVSDFTGWLSSTVIMLRVMWLDL